MQHPEHEFIFIFDREYDDQFLFAPNVKPLILSPKARHPILYYIWFEIRLPALLNKIKPDLFFSPDGYLPLSYKGPCLTVFHDLNFEHYPEDLPFAERKFYRHFFPKFARKADRIATVSEFSKQDIQRQYHIEASKIDVVYNGVNEAYQQIDPDEQEKTRERYAQSCPYFLFVGSLHPRKNLARLFQAYDRFRKENAGNVKLLIIGARKWWTPPIQQAYDAMQFKQDVLFAGRLTVNDLSKVMGSALALTYISYFEGFGIPLLEAFASHTPVITANVTSLPEIAGEAALLTDPFSVESIANAMASIASDKDLRKSLVEKGNLRVKDFSWERSASLLYESMMKTIESPINS